MAIPAYTENMPQVCSYWEPGEPNPLGGFSPGTRYGEVKCRWETKNVLFRNVDGVQDVATDVVYVGRPIERQGYLALGSNSIDDAIEIRQINVSPSLDGSTALYKAFL